MTLEKMDASKKFEHTERAKSKLEGAYSISTQLVLN